MSLCGVFADMPKSSAALLPFKQSFDKSLPKGSVLKTAM